MKVVVCSACGKRYLLVGNSEITDLLCSCEGDDVRPAELEEGIYELVPLDEDEARPSPQPRHAPPREDDLGYGESHGYAPGHGGPAGPGDAPAPNDPGESRKAPASD